MDMSESDRAYVEANPSAAMITVTPSGAAKAVRVGLAVVEGRLWSSSTRDRARTRRLRSDPRCTLFVFDRSFGYQSLETTVAILDGPDVPDLSVRLFRTMQGKPSGPLSWFGAELEEDAFRQTMVDEGRVIYEFTVGRSYGLH